MKIIKAQVIDEEHERQKIVEKYGKEAKTTFEELPDAVICHTMSLLPM